MSHADHWLDRYGRDHTHTANRVLHCICIPLILVAAVGLLWSVPVPAPLRDASPALNWGTVFLMAAVVYYFIISITLAVGMLPFVVLVTLVVSWLENFDTPLWLISVAILGVAGAGQVIGHLFERRAGSLLFDLNLLIIGPLWLLAAVYQRLRIPY